MQSALDKKLVKNALIISFGMLFAKLLGAFYRIPLTNSLGSNGLGLYQMVFPVYCILLDFAGASIPCALSKLISSNVGEDAEEKNVNLLKVSLYLMAFLGIVFSIFMFVLSKPLASLQGNKEAYLAYRTLSPSIFFVALISCYRGYFQGKQEMMPSAISQIVEQVLKLTAGLILLTLVSSISKKSAVATLAITISEVFAFFYLVLVFKKKHTKTRLLGGKMAQFKQNSFSIFKLCLPLTLTSILIPFSQTIDSFLIVNILKKYTENATSLYGLFSGGMMSIICLPVSLCYGLSVAIIPSISEKQAKNNKDDGTKWIVIFTAVFSLMASFFLLIFAKLIVKILFFNLSLEEKLTMVKLLKISSTTVFFMALTQTTNSVLVGKGLPYVPVISLAFGIAIKLIIELIFLPNPRFNIYAGAISVNICYFVAVFINLLYIIRVSKKTFKKA